MVTLELDNEDRLILQGSPTDPGVLRVFKNILLAFVVVDQNQSSLVLERVADNVEAIHYIVETAERSGVLLALGEGPKSIIARYDLEKSQFEQARENCTDDEPIDPIPGFKPDLLLLSHQESCVKRIMQSGNFADFSVQGAGKTMTVLAAFAHWQSRGIVEKLLVIGPVSSFQPWEDEVNRCFEDEISTLRWSGSASVRARMVSAYLGSSIVLCSYDTARRDVAMLREQLKATSTLLVLDESHYIKNFDVGARGATALELAPHATKRLVLSGTPAPHSLLDLYTQFAFLWPGTKHELLGTPQQFLTTLSRAANSADELRGRLAPYFHRTGQSQLGLPEPETITEAIPASEIPDGQTKIIRLLENKLAVEIRNLPSIKDRDLVTRWRRARIVRLLQAASNPSLLSTTEGMPTDERADFDVGELTPLISKFREGSVKAAKFAWTIDKATEIISRGNKILIWTWWVSNIHMLSEALQEFNPLILYGQIKPYEDFEDPNDISRERYIREFKMRDDRPLLIANPSACAEAISLHQVCHDAIYMDRTYNCGQFLQSLNRIHRIGLPTGVVTRYWIPVVDCAVERSVDRRLKTRQKNMFQFLGDDAPVLGIDWREESHVADSDDETHAAFEDLTNLLPK